MSGESPDLLRFSKWLERQTIDNPHGVNFVLGGDVGLDDAVRAGGQDPQPFRYDPSASDCATSFWSKAEIYRACTLMRNIPHHK